MTQRIPQESKLVAAGESDISSESTQTSSWPSWRIRKRQMWLRWRMATCCNGESAQRPVLDLALQHSPKECGGQSTSESPPALRPPYFGGAINETFVLPFGSVQRVSLEFRLEHVDRVYPASRVSILLLLLHWWRLGIDLRGPEGVSCCSTVGH